MRGRLDPARAMFDCVRFSGVGGILDVGSFTSIFDWVRFKPDTGIFGVGSATSILDCVRFNLFDVFALPSRARRSGLDGVFFSGAVTGLWRLGSARKVEGWLAIESIFLNCFW